MARTPRHLLEVKRLQKQIAKLEKPLFAAELKLARLDHKFNLSLSFERKYRFDDEIQEVFDQEAGER